MKIRFDSLADFNYIYNNAPLLDDAYSINGEGNVVVNCLGVQLELKGVGVVVGIYEGTTITMYNKDRGNDSFIDIVYAVKNGVKNKRRMEKAEALMLAYYDVKNMQELWALKIGSPTHIQSEFYKALKMIEE